MVLHDRPAVIAEKGGFGEALHLVIEWPEG